MVTRLHSGGSVADTSLPLLHRDPLLYNANGGVLFLADFAFSFCRPRVAPVNGQDVKDVSGRPGDSLMSGHADGSIAMTGAGTISFNTDKNGLGFAGAAVGNNLVIPSEVSAAIAASAQHILYCIYVTLPSEANWVAGTTMAPFLNMGGGSSGYVNGANWLSLGITSNGSGTERFQAVRQKGAAVNSADVLGFDAAAGDYSAMTQIAFWTAGTSQNLRIKNASRTASASSSGTPTANTVSGVDAVTGQFGIGTSFWAGTTAAAKDFLGHRVWIENLDVSGRDAVEVLDDDWQRQVDRGVFA